MDRFIAQISRAVDKRTTSKSAMVVQRRASVRYSDPTSTQPTCNTSYLRGKFRVVKDTPHEQIFTLRGKVGAFAASGH